MSTTVELTDEEHAAIAYAFRHPRGRYSAERAAQLSGLPKSTVYDWQRKGVLVPDYPKPRSMYWSYRDLVFLRMLGWLRSQGIARPAASELIGRVRAELATPASDVDRIRTDGRVVLIGSDQYDKLTGQGVLPSIDSLLSVFQILEPIDEPGIGNRRLWGPDLVHPSELTYISPWIMGGEPCIIDSRVPTSSLLALQDERGLDTADIIELYPGLSAKAIDDGVTLERRLRAPAFAA